MIIIKTITIEINELNKKVKIKYDGDIQLNELYRAIQIMLEKIERQTNNSFKDCIAAIETYHYLKKKEVRQ